MKKAFLKLCSTLLTLVLLLQMVPIAALGAEDTTGTDTASSVSQTEEAFVVSELPQGRGQYHKEFLLSNGNHMAAVYADAVHYERDGQWLEIDNTLKLSGTGTSAVYTNTAGPWQVSFPQQLSPQKAVTITKDGHTLHFYMSGQLRSSGNVAIMSTEDLTLNQPDTITAQPAQVDTAALQAKSKYPQTVAQKNHARLEYSSVFSGTDVVYDLVSDRVKESIVIGQYNAQVQGYRYTLQTGDMVPVLQDSGQILLYDAAKSQVIMDMPAPYLVDAAGEYCYNVGVALKGNGGNYQLIYLLDNSWMADETRKYPVILDPVVHNTVDVNNIQDISVYEKKTTDYRKGVLLWGNIADYGIMRGFVKYNVLPALSSSDTIVNATFRLHAPENYNTTATLQLHKVLDTWTSSTTTWENQPDFDDTIEDFGQVQAAGFYYFDVTDITRDWYEGENTGLMFRATDAIENATGLDHRAWRFTSSDYDIYQYDEKPTLFIEFRNSNGLESYWDYTSASAGRAGTGYVNNYTGNLVWVRPDIGFGGNRMPVAISHVYNANDAQTNRFGAGYGWRTNFNQLVYHWDEPDSYGDYYVWEDGDGTSHYFQYQSAGVYKDEDGLELTLKVTSNGYTIEDKYGNLSTFDSQGRLVKQSNNQKTPSHITVTYTNTTDKQIAKITDGVGRAYNFTYSGSLLSRISYTGSGTSEVSYVSFGYTVSDLTSITDKDGKTSAFAYGSNHLLLSGSDIDGYKLTYTYTAPTDPSWQPYRVKTIAESDGTAQGGSLSIEYAHNQTTFTDHNGHIQIFQFNNLGNTVSVQDSEGRAQFAGYSLNGTETTIPANAKNNQLAISSKLQNTVGNLAQDSSFENGTVWRADSIATVSSTSEDAYHGNYSLKVVSTGGEAYYGARGFNVEVAPGETVTISAYVKNPDSTVRLGLRYVYDNYKYYARGWLYPASNEWTRVEASWTNNWDVTLSPLIVLLTPNAGTYYMDCIQVEKNQSASRYNLIENGDFRHSGSPAYGWTGSGLSSADIPSTITSAAPQLDHTAFRITGAPFTTKQLNQTVKVSGSAGDSFVLSGWAKGDSAPLTDSSRKFGLKATVHYTDGTAGDFSVSFNPDADSSINWQYAAVPIVTAKAYSSITVTIDYSNNVNTAYFDGIQLFKERFGSSYTYDANGNVTAVKDIQGGTTAYTYNTAGDLTKQTLPNGSVLTYAYDGYHNVTKATSDEGVVYDLTYDDYGNNLTVAIGSGITSRAAYTSDGNRLSSTTDALGKVTTYSYNADTNVLEWVKYPNDTDNTRTNYSYDSMYRLASAAATTDTGSALTASYTYTDDLLTRLQTDSTAYNFTYGDFAQRTSIKIGSTALATYAYTEDRNRYLEQLTYGNGDFVHYSYDDYGRVIRETHEDGSTVDYVYDNTGSLAKVADSATGNYTLYYYDLTGRLQTYKESLSGSSHVVSYVYDQENKLTALSEEIGGTQYTTSYTYDDDNRVTSVTDRGITESYTYDSYGRVAQKVTKNGSATVLTETYTYKTTSDGKPTGQVATHRSVSTGRDVTYTYHYDANGNIVSVSDGTDTTTYAYDSANQLIRENNQAANKTWTYDYDDAGNIWTMLEYVYSTGELVTGTDAIYYCYDGGSWGDLLTGLTWDDVTHDAIGNTLSDGTWTYTWRNGRELASMTDGTQSWQFTYNADGMRTKKTNGTDTYSYIYNGGSLSQLRVSTSDGTETTETQTLNFAYDASGIPMALTYGGTTYYYATNLQGDVVAILDSTGTAVVTYTYDAWGELLSTTGSLASTLGQLNPLRYRGYVYDQETGLYYLQSRYYDPTIGRFINADAFVSTGQGLLGNNMFAYCRNNPVSRRDISGTDDESCFADETKEDLIYQPDGGATGIQYGTSDGIPVGNNWIGYGQAPKQGPPGSTYTQVSSNGDNSIVSKTIYNEYGVRGQRIDYSGRDHHAGLPHVHTYSYRVIDGSLRQSKETIERYFEE